MQSIQVLLLILYDMLQNKLVFLKNIYKQLVFYTSKVFALLQLFVDLKQKVCRENSASPLLFSPSRSGSG